MEPIPRMTSDQARSVAVEELQLAWSSKYRC